MPTDAFFEAAPMLVAKQARQDPDRVAIRTDSAEISYGQLEKRANQLAHYLLGLRAGREVLIGISLERSPGFVITALAVMKSGAAYLPIDPGDPRDRLTFIAKDAQAKVIVTNQEFGGAFSDSNLKIVRIDADAPAIDRQSTTSPAIDIGADDLAYVIYTSGSTGQPKGVEIVHRNLSNLIAWHLRAFHVDESTRATFQAGIGFDAAVWEIWPHLAAGASIHLPDDSIRMDAEALRDWLVENGITISFVPTAIAEQLIALPWPKETALQFLLTGADALHRFPPPGLPFAFVNNYGPTECAVVTTSGIIAARSNGEGLPSIGSPIDNVQVHILDDQLRDVPADKPGEICIGGSGVGRGYRNRPKLTSEKFVVRDNARLYRTGDLGRRLSNGEIAFLGRADDQVKIRGYRIELGEINSVLNEQH